MELPDNLELRAERAAVLRYGENPHQQAALYIDIRPGDGHPGVARGKQLQGKDLSFNNIADADAAFQCVAEFSEPAAVIVKHMNPCGAALGISPLEAYRKALACDPISAFGGIVALNRPLDREMARELIKIFLEVVAAPIVDKESLAILATKPHVRVIETGGMPSPAAEEISVRTVAGGFLVETRDAKLLDGEPRTVTKRSPTREERSDLLFAFAVSKHVKSNAVCYARDRATLGIGAGQMSRIDSARIAALKAADAKLDLAGSVMASDAFMPFPDVVEAAARAGATAIIQPGGSKNDRAAIEAADRAGMAMLFTGVRHFRH